MSHEFFHTWNVKRLRPAGIVPYDWKKENYVRELWLAEGGTSYYGNLQLVRMGFMSVSDYFRRLASNMEQDLAARSYHPSAFSK